MRDTVTKEPTVNLRKVAEPRAVGRMRPAGFRVFETRDRTRESVYTYERPVVALSSDLEARFRGHPGAWESFQAQPAGYQRLCCGWVMGGKQQTTRERRLARLMDESAGGRPGPVMVNGPQQRDISQSAGLTRMGRLIYSMSVSLDGFIETRDRSLDWITVDEELHQYFNDEARAMSTFLYGRRMYELMSGYWPTGNVDPAATPAMREFAAIWRDTPKVVFSRTLERVDWNSRLVREDAVREVARLKGEPGLDMDVGGPTIAASLMSSGLIDEYRVFVQPVVLGGGTPFFPSPADRVRLRLLETRTFGSGVVLLRYEAADRL